MQNSVTIGELLAITATVVLMLLSIISFFVKRELSHVEEKIATNKSEAKAVSDKSESEIKAQKTEFAASLINLRGEISAGRTMLEVSQKELYAKLEAKLEAYSRESVTDGRSIEDRLDELRDDFRRELEKQRDAIHVAERSLLEKIAVFGEKYLLKEAFIRDNTLLDSKIVTTARSMAKVEQNVDALLQRFLDDAPRNPPRKGGLHASCPVS